MTEEAYNRVRQDDFAQFTFTSERTLDAFIRRAEKYNAEFEVERHKVNGKFDTAIVYMNDDHVRPLRYLIATSNS